MAAMQPGPATSLDQVIGAQGLGSMLYLGGWRGFGVEAVPALGVAWVLLKAALVAFVIIWVRVSWPRLREDQLQHLAWARLVPIALAQLAITAVGVVMAA